MNPPLGSKTAANTQLFDGGRSIRGIQLSADTGLLQSLADLFQHLSDPRRLQLLLTLANSEHSVGELASHLGVTSSAVSHQLQTLRRARLVTSRRKGQMIYYRLSDDHVKQLVNMGREHVMEARP